MTVVDLHDFAGGLNLRDSLEELGRNETPDAVNMTLTTRGAVVVRNGCTQAVTLPAGTVRMLFYSPLVDKWFCQVGNFIHIRPGDLSGAWVSHINMGASNPVAAVDFRKATSTTGHVCFVQSGTAGPWFSDGTTGTSVAQVSGATMALFKNRLWLCDSGHTDIPTRTRLFFSALAAGDSWTVGTDFVDVREKDMEPITALASVGGALLVFKKRSAYRVTDAATGAYTTIDWANGCVGPRAIAIFGGLVYTWGIDGIYAWDGVGKGVRVSDKVLPRFLSNTATDASLASIAAGIRQDRVVFAYPLDASTNNRLLELRARDLAKADDLPGSAWIMEHTLAQSGEDEIVALANKGTALYAAMDDGDVMYSMFDGTPGADDGTNFTSNYKTPPLNLGQLHRLQRARVYGKSASSATSTKELRTYKDWSSSVSDTFDITTSLETGDGEEATDLQGLGHAEAFQLEFRCSGGTGTAELDRLLLDLTQLTR